MSQTSGFFISQGGDRKYTPDWLAKYISALVTTGVYKDECGVTAAGGMSVTVDRGRAWIEGYLYMLDAPQTLTLSNADGIRPRKDIIVLRLDLTVREITVCVVEGVPNSDPAPSALVRTADVYELELAEITVPAGAARITQDLIRDTRLDDALCGITVSAVQHIPTASYLEQMLASFKMWFDSVKGILGGDEAGNLLRMIQSLSYTRDFSESDWEDGEDGECTMTIPAYEHGMTGDTAECQAFIKVSGDDGDEYRSNAWAAMETYATVAENGDVVVHYPHGEGYSGRLVLKMHQNSMI